MNETIVYLAKLLYEAGFGGFLIAGALISSVTYLIKYAIFHFAVAIQGWPPSDCNSVDEEEEENSEQDSEEEA